jgi:hypothetical protein
MAIVQIPTFTMARVYSPRTCLLSSFSFIATSPISNPVQQVIMLEHVLARYLRRGGSSVSLEAGYVRNLPGREAVVKRGAWDSSSTLAGVSSHFNIPFAVAC